MMDGFKFVHDGRTFTCSIEPMRAARSDAWWWFRVSTDRHRYAPFRAAETDTLDGVQARVAAYYNQLLARRAAPPDHYFRRGRRLIAGSASPAEAVPGSVS